ncbi:acyl-CoA thioesterase domain-containing protein [Shigella flexneri]
MANLRYTQLTLACCGSFVTGELYESGAKKFTDIAKTLEKIEERAFSRTERRLGLRKVFGGQVVGQALYPPRRPSRQTIWCTRFRGYFLRPGDSAKPIVYDVEVLRDGRSRARRRGGSCRMANPSST